MSGMKNLFTTLKYITSTKSEPVFNNYFKIITDFSELDSKINDPFDANGRQCYTEEHGRDGTFICSRISEDESKELERLYAIQCEEYGIPATKKWTWSFKSMACDSQKKFRINIYKPGRIVVKSTLTESGWPSPWLFSSLNEGDFDNPYLNPIDKLSGRRNYYWEIDMFETFQDSKCARRIAFNGHYGTQSNRQWKGKAIKWPFDGDKMHYTEVIWDGKGNWKWLMDSIEVSSQFIPQPEEQIYPYFLLTLAATTNMRVDKDLVKWKVDYIKFSDNIIVL